MTYRQEHSGKEKELNIFVYYTGQIMSFDNKNRAMIHFFWLRVYLCIFPFQICKLSVFIIISLFPVFCCICSHTYSLDLAQHILILQNIFPICLPRPPDCHGNQGLNYGYLQCGWIINQLTRGTMMKAVFSTSKVFQWHILSQEVKSW